MPRSGAASHGPMPVQSVANSMTTAAVSSTRLASAPTSTTRPSRTRRGRVEVVGDGAAVAGDEWGAGTAAGTAAGDEAPPGGISSRKAMAPMRTSSRSESSRSCE